MCSLLLSLLSDPSGSSDSLHSGSVTPRLRSPSLPAVCQCVSVSSPALSPSLCCLVYFHRSQPRSRRVEGSALPAQTAATSGRPRTNLPAPLLLPHGPAFLLLLLLLLLALLPRRRRRLEGDPDLTVFLRPVGKALKKPRTPKVEQHFRFALGTGEGGRGETEKGEKKRETLDTKPSVKRWLVSYGDEGEVGSAVPWTPSTFRLFLSLPEQSSRSHGPFLLCASQRATQSSNRGFEAPERVNSSAFPRSAVAGALSAGEVRFTAVNRGSVWNHQQN